MWHTFNMAQVFISTSLAQQWNHIKVNVVCKPAQQKLISYHYSSNIADIGHVYSYLSFKNAVSLGTVLEAQVAALVRHGMI